MLIQILISLIMGVLSGTITGLIPGIHINLIGVFLISLSASLFSSKNKSYLIIFISSMAITHTFIDFIPSIFLGCPDTDTELSILPGHELLKKGQGYQAIILTCYGSLAAIFILILIFLPSMLIIPKIQNILPTIIPGLLIFCSFFLVSKETKKFFAILIFLISGIFGYVVLNFSSINQPLLPLLSGLFGSSMLITSIKNKTQIPKQEVKKPKIKLFKPLLGSLIASPICSFLPGLGSGQAAIIGNSISKTDKKGFLVLLGATNTLVMGFSFITLYLISKTRTGAASAIKEIIGNLNLNLLILILITIFISGIISFFLTKNLAKFFSQKIHKINYTKISIITLIVLSIIILVISKFMGLIIFIMSTLIGLFCIFLKVRRTNMMGCLLIPTIILYLI